MTSGIDHDYTRHLSGKMECRATECGLINMNLTRIFLMPSSCHVQYTMRRKTCYYCSCEKFVRDPSDTRHDL